jgi:hypothetical protein
MVTSAQLEVVMATKGFSGPAAKRMKALEQELDAEPSKGSGAQHDAWRERVLGRATALFRMVGKRAGLDQMRPAQRKQLVELLGEAVLVAKQLASTPAH